MGIFSFFGNVLGLYVLFACTLASSDVFDSVLGNTASCHKSCGMTYSLHTYPREEELYACQRGCRLFSICHFVRDSDDLNQTKSECESTCREAYAQPDEQYACNMGCHNELPFAEQRQDQLEAMMPRIHLLYPLTLVRGFWDDVMSQAQGFITSTWTFYLQADDGKVVVFQSEPQVRIFAHVELDKDSKEEHQKSCKHISLFFYTLVFNVCPKMSLFRTNVKCCNKFFRSEVFMDSSWACMSTFIHLRSYVRFMTILIGWFPGTGLALKYSPYLSVEFKSGLKVFLLFPFQHTKHTFLLEHSTVS
ncbi:hypothetical protein XENORESO_007828 [Xenotaenia resolanae]|uniref:Transmembrane protein 59 n=1 Tax=Xenotaenia resolanae TaxID=208358 RepID=A0ABV0VLK0_9TELE